MSKDEALKLALEALEKSDGFLYYWHESASDDEADDYAAARQLNEQAMTSIKEALAEDALQRLSDIHQEMEPQPVTWSDYEPDGMHHNKPAKPQPVAYIGMVNGDHFDDVCRKANGNSNTPLYAAPPQQEPVAWLTKTGSVWKTKADETDTPLYTSPPQRTWVGLTTADRKEIERQSVYVEGAIRLTEAKLKEKNT